MDRNTMEPYRLLRLCVDSCEQGAPAGRLYHPELENGCFSFQSLAQLLVRLEQFPDPDEGTGERPLKRSFGPIPSCPAVPSEVPRGKLGSFELRLMFREHTGWQGTLSWAEGGEIPFQSELELIRQLDSALGSCVSSPTFRGGIS